MADTPEVPSSSSSPASALSPAEQARIRRERRQAKVRDGGSSRLTKITGTQGLTFTRDEPTRPSSASADESPAPASSPPSLPPPTNGETRTPDPPEFDISEHHYTPGADCRGPQAGGNPNEELRQLMMMEQMFGGRGAGGAAGSPFGMPGGSPGASPFAGTPGAGPGEDPMAALMAQMMGGQPGGGAPDIEEMMRNMSGMAGMMGGNGAVQEVARDPWAPWWRAVHMICSVFITLYSISWGFDGTWLGRVESANAAASEKPQLFYYFATMELVLQSTRFMVERGRPPQGSILATIGKFLPPPFGTALATLSRYSVIWSTIMADAAVVIFMLGMVYWWNS